MVIKVRQEAEYRSEGIWSWSVWLDGSSDELDQIEQVTYVLHPSYPKPLRRVHDRHTNFRLAEEGWSNFVLAIDILFKDGSKQQLTHEVDLEKGVGTAQPRVEQISAKRLGSETQKKLLSIDSDGVRATISLKILARIE